VAEAGPWDRNVELIRQHPDYCVDDAGEQARGHGEQAPAQRSQKPHGRSSARTSRTGAVTPAADVLRQVESSDHRDMAANPGLSVMGIFGAVRPE